MHGRAVVVVVVLGLGLLGAACTKSNNLADAGNGDSADASSDGADAAGGDGGNLPVCPTSTHQCVAVPPSSAWSGPVVRASSNLPTEPPACGTNYGLEAAEVFDGLAATGTCTCSCSDDAAGVTCTNATIRGYYAKIGNEAPCTAPVSNTTQSLVAGGSGASCSTSDLASNSSIADIYVTMGTVSASGTCSETPGVLNAIVPATFATQDRFCEVETPIAARCDADNTCAPMIDNGFDAELCIYQAGEHACDESGVYTEQFIRYQGMDDQRSCGSCSCKGPNVGNVCGGVVRTGVTSNNCNGTLLPAGCHSDPFTNTSDGAKYLAIPNIKCQTSGGGVVGQATATGAMTFCCQATGE